MPEHYESADVVVPRVRAADIVVLNAPPTHALARAIRDRGAHALWQIDSLRDRADGIDAYVLTGRAADGAQIVAAIMPSAGIVALKEMRGNPYRELGWGSLLADVVWADRDECVGGTLGDVHPVVPCLSGRSSEPATARSQLLDVRLNRLGPR